MTYSWERMGYKPHKWAFLSVGWILAESYIRTRLNCKLIIWIRKSNFSLHIIVGKCFWTVSSCVIEPNNQIIHKIRSFKEILHIMKSMRRSLRDQPSEKALLWVSGMSRLDVLCFDCVMHSIVYSICVVILEVDQERNDNKHVEENITMNHENRS